MTLELVSAQVTTGDPDAGRCPGTTIITGAAEQAKQQNKLICAAGRPMGAVLVSMRFYGRSLSQDGNAQ